MPIFYLDASAIAKLYLPGEQGVVFMVDLLSSRSPDDILVTSALCFVEVKSAISRRISNLSDKSALLEAYDRDAREIFDSVDVHNEIIVEAGAVVEKHRLRAADAIHLATALSLAATAASQVFMVSADTELLQASEAAGIEALDPQTDEALGVLRQIRQQ